MSEPNPPWSPPFKRTVALILLVLIALIIYRFQTVIPPLVIAFLAAFILDPIVDFLTQRLHLARGLATTLVFLVIIVAGLALVATPVAIVPSPREIANVIQSVLRDTLTSVDEFFKRPLEIGEYPLDLSGVYEELSASVQSYIGSVVQGTFRIAGSIAEGAFWLIFILIASFYLVKDIDRVIEMIDDLAPPGYRDDFVKLRHRITDVWHAFLRGQLLLAVILAAVTTAIFGAIGVPYAWVMGLLAGILAFIPNIGQVAAAVPPILLAYFRGSRFLPMNNLGFAILVAAIYIAINLAYNNVLVPLLLGESLKLHPLVVMIAAIVGGLIGGILGMLLAAPTMATLRIISHYIICRLYDRDPFIELEPEEKIIQKRRSLKQFYLAVLSRLRRDGEKLKGPTDELEGTWQEEN
jgi:predicted PurR-regulated permease PerM